MNLTETQLSSEPIFDGKFVIRHPGAACVLAVTEADEVVLVRQWRYATGQALLELPAGKLDPDEDPAVCAARELEEETPYRAQSVRLLHTFYTAPGFCNEKMYLYLAEGITPTSTRNPDQDEFVETVLLSRQAVREAIANNRIQDGKTLVGLQYWLLNSPPAD